MNDSVFTLAELPKLNVPGDLFDVRFISTGNFSVAFNKLKKGAEVPMHTHEHETIDYVIDGTLELIIDGEISVMSAGSVAHVASNVPHAATALTDCSVINIFYPVREDFQAVPDQQ